MTSSIRSGIKDDHSVQSYKPHDPFEEPGLVSILFLSCGKYPVTSAALSSTIEALQSYGGEVEWLFLEQGDHGADPDRNLALYNRFHTERKVILRPNHNFGINNGLNALWAISRGQYCMIHENDFVNEDPLFPFMDHAKDILDEHPDIGLVQLRAIHDPAENFGLNKPLYNPWSCDVSVLTKAGIKVWEQQTSRGHTFLMSEFPGGFHNNPILMRKSLYRECGPYPEPPMTADMRHGETAYQKRIADTSCAIAHIRQSLYFHMGGSRLKEIR